MSDWHILFPNAHKPPVLDYDWAPIDALVPRLAQLQVQARASGEASAELQDGIAELERHISTALERGASLGELGERTKVSQRDLARVRDTGRLYDR